MAKAKRMATAAWTWTWTAGSLVSVSVSNRSALSDPPTTSAHGLSSAPSPISQSTVACDVAKPDRSGAALEGQVSLAKPVSRSLQDASASVRLEAAEEAGEKEGEEAAEEEAATEGLGYEERLAEYIVLISDEAAEFKRLKHLKLWSKARGGV